MDKNVFPFTSFVRFTLSTLVFHLPFFIALLTLKNSLQCNSIGVYYIFNDLGKHEKILKAGNEHEL
ncbi:MAG: hypothetical protein KA120_01525 [Candidatus Goldbacteria bacterium]|nr:hypothetical protein [Candidatus Goldiibacteriota bacterium]